LIAEAVSIRESNTCSVESNATHVVVGCNARAMDVFRATDAFDIITTVTERVTQFITVTILRITKAAAVGIITTTSVVGFDAGS
jgi:hypothetical protein